MHIHGLDINIETPKGRSRTGVGADGKRWVGPAMPCSYGEIKRTRAADGDRVDAYIGSDRDSPKVWVIDQVKDGKYDEAKTLIGFKSKDAALSAYRAAFSDGKADDRIGAVTEMSVEQFTDWLSKPGATKKPVGMRGHFATGGKIDMPHNNQDAIAIALNIAGRQKKADGGRTGYAPGGWIGEDVSPADLTRDIMLPNRPAPRVPLSGASGPAGEPVYPPEGTPDAPDTMPSWYRAIQPYSVNVPAAVEGLAMSTGMTGGPAGAVTEGAKYLAKLAKQYATPAAVGFGGASLLSSPAGSEDRPGALLERMLTDKNELMKQRAAAQSDLDAQAKGGKGKDGKPIAAGRGPQYDAAAKRLLDLDTQLSETNTQIKVEQRRIEDAQKAAAKTAYDNSPEGKLKAEKEKKDFDDQQAAKERGKPVRENLPGFMQDAVIPAATYAGYRLTKGLASKANAEYARALERFATAEKAADFPSMALAKAQLQQLENPGLGRKAWEGTKMGLSALLPFEIRGMETAIDLAKDPQSRAFKEANDRIHDPWAVGRDIGTTLASSAFAGAAGTKRATPHVDRSLGRAIAENPNPYAAAPALAAGYSDALKLSEDVGRLRQSASGAPTPAAIPLASEATERAPEVQRALDVASRQRQLPAPEAVPNLSARKASSAAPLKDWAVEAPAGAPALPKGYHWHQRADGTIQPKNEATGQWGEMPKYTPPKSSPKSKEPVGASKANEKGTDDPAADYFAKNPGALKGQEGRNMGGSVSRDALDLARRYASGGHVDEPVHVGGMMGDTGGREDALPVSVPSGSFILPADVVSALGQNNTLSGIKALEKMFGPSHKAAGGPTTPIQISDGEYIVNPEAVARIGGGNQDAGHRALDKLVLQVRKQHINALKKLPPPAPG